MRNLSKVLILFFVVFISMQSFAQKFGVQAGVNLANMVSKDDAETYSDDFEMNLGFNAGVTFELSFSDFLGLEMGALVDTKGFKISESGATAKINLLYADIPVLLKGGPTLGAVKIFGAAGPYLGVGITGKYTFEFDGDKESEDVVWGDGDDADLKRLDYGAKFGVGAEVKGFSIGAYYALGLANIAVDNSDGYKESHRVVSFSVGYKFGK